MPAGLLAGLELGPSVHASEIARSGACSLSQVEPRLASAAAGEGCDGGFRSSLPEGLPNGQAMWVSMLRDKDDLAAAVWHRLCWSRPSAAY